MTPQKHLRDAERWLYFSAASADTSLVMGVLWSLAFAFGTAHESLPILAAYMVACTLHQTAHWRVEVHLDALRALDQKEAP